jgi:hypothetical protein
MFNVHGSMHHNNILVYKSQQDTHASSWDLYTRIFVKCIVQRLWILPLMVADFLKVSSLY